MFGPQLVEPGGLALGADGGTAFVETGLRTEPHHLVDGGTHRRIEINGGDPSKQPSVLEVLPQGQRELARTPHIDVPFLHVERDLVDVAIAGEDCRRRLCAPPRESGEPVGRVTDDTEIVGDRLGWHTELLDHSGPVVEDLTATVELNHPTVRSDALSEVLVGGADDDLLHAFVGCGHRRARSHRIVGFVGDLGPHLESGHVEQLLDLGELGEDVGVDVGPVLVAVVEIIAPRLDHVVGGDSDVRRPIGDQIEHRVEHAALRSEPGFLVRRREVIPKELVRSVDQVNLHGRESAIIGRTMAVPPTGLPIEEQIADLSAALEATGHAVLTAEPGAGKTTVVPLRLLESDWLSDRKIVVLEPRRVAARAAARRMAAMLGEEPGQTVGWVTRDDRRVGPATRIEVVTEGVLTARLVRDPSLESVGVVIFDEFHERSLPGDTGFALALHSRATAGLEAKLLVMSATIDSGQVADALGGEGGPAPVIECPGRTFPVDLIWRPRRPRSPLVPAVVKTVSEALRGSGDVLVFLPGVGEIRRTERELGAALGPNGPAILPLHGSLPSVEQDAALIARASQRVVLATDLAETSLTVDGITAVVDAGLARVPRFDTRTEMTALTTVSASRASADQRAGRAGRLGPGAAFRMWSKVEHASRPPFLPPEITEVEIAGLVLDLARRGIRHPSELPFLDPPAETAWAAAVELLGRLGALDEAGLPTELGLEMAELPLHPRLARMVVGGRDPWLACQLAALLEDRDVLRGRPADLPADMGERLTLVLDEDHHHPSADGRALQQVRRRAGDLARRRGIATGLVDRGEIGRTLLLGFPDRLARPRAGVRGRWMLADQRPAKIDRQDPLAGARGLVAVDLGGRPKEPVINRAARLEATIDHIVYATPDLDATTAEIIEQWGVKPTIGGSHDGRGTRNVLLALGGPTYLEVIGPDSDQPEPDQPRPFGIDDLDAPALVNWAAGVPDLDAWIEWARSRGVDPGPTLDMQRTTPAGHVLKWRLTFPLPEGEGILPFLIEWPGETPAATAAPGLSLMEFSLRHPDPAMANRLHEYAVPVDCAQGERQLRATLLGPTGVIELS